MEQPKNLTELKDQLAKKLEEAKIATSMATYKSQESLDISLGIKSNKKLIAHFKKGYKTNLEIVAAISEHAKNAIELSLQLLSILAAKEPKREEVKEEVNLPETEGTL